MWRPLWIALACASCWTSSGVSDVETVAAPRPIQVKPRCPPDRVSGMIYDRHYDDEPVVGATVVLSKRDGVAAGPDDSDITDARGAFSLRRRPGLDTITVYYADATFRARIPAQACKLHAGVSVAAGMAGDVVDLVFDPPKRGARMKSR